MMLVILLVDKVVSPDVPLSENCWVRKYRHWVYWWLLVHKLPRHLYTFSASTWYFMLCAGFTKQATACPFSQDGRQRFAVSDKQMDLAHSARSRVCARVWSPGLNCQLWSKSPENTSECRNPLHMGHVCPQVVIVLQMVFRPLQGFLNDSTSTQCSHCNAPHHFGQ